MPMDYETNAACTPYPKRLTKAACAPYLRGVHPGGACMPMDYESVSPTQRARRTLGACTNAASTPYPKRLTNAARTPYPKRLTNAARTPYLRDVHPGGACMPMDYESVSPTRRARHTLGTSTLVECACPPPGLAPLRGGADP